MDFSVVLEQYNTIEHCFTDGKMTSTESNEDEPILINGSIYVEDANSNNKRIGWLTLYQLYNDDDLFLKCDNVSGDCSAVASVINRSKATLKKLLSDDFDYATIYILDHIEIDKEYRSLGIGSAIIQNLLKMIQFQFGDEAVLFLCVGAYEAADKFGYDSKEHKTANKRLIRFYERAGFRLIKENVMVYCPKNI